MSYIESAVSANVLSITINRPDKKNALTLHMYRQMSELLLDAENDESVSVVTICGGETCFSAGNDLQDFLAAGVLDDDHPVVNFLQVISAFKKPIIAGVAGYAVGIGTTLLMHCDLVYAEPSAIFQLPFVPLGLCPEAASSLILPNLAGYHKAAELLMFGEPFSVEQAQDYGLVNRIVGQGEVKDYVAERAAHLAALPQDAVMTTKRLLKAGHDEVMAAMDAEIVQFGRLLHSQACRDIIKSKLG